MYRELFRSIFVQRPAHLILHVTSRCNYACKTCFVDFNKYRGSEDLTIREISEIAGFYKNLLWLDISGGEPFLREDLAEICAKFNAANLSIPTNCFDPALITERVIEIKKKTTSVLSVSISMDGFENINDEIRRKGSFLYALETIKRLKKISNIRVKVNTVLTEKNYEELIPFMAFVSELGVNFHSIIFKRGKTAGKEYSCPSPEKFKKIKAEIYKKWEFYNYGLNRFSAGILRNYQKQMFEASCQVMEKNYQYPRCLAYKYHSVIYPDGDIAFCENRCSFGNIRRQKISELLNSVNAKQHRKEIQKGECFCFHPCNMLDNYFLNPKKYFSLLIG